MKITILRLGKITLSAFFGSVLLLTSCTKDEDPVIETQPVVHGTPTETLGVYVLCEGSYGSGSESKITYYDIKTGITEPDHYQKVNGKPLGNNANDLQLYGSKIYCVVTGNDAANTSYVDVMEASTGKSIKRINFSDASGAFHPRYIVFNKNKAYVSNYDGKVSRLDTASLEIETNVTLSKGLEQLVISNNKLYVANSQHPYYIGKGNVVSVIDLNTFTKTRDIEVLVNPSHIISTLAGDILVSSQGSWGENNAGVARINTATDKKTAVYNYEEAVNLISANGMSFLYSMYSDNYFNHYSVSDGTVGKSFITDGTTFADVYGVKINPLSNDVYVADANAYGDVGKLFCISRSGKKKFEVSTSSTPKSVEFKYAYQY